MSTSSDEGWLENHLGNARGEAWERGLPLGKTRALTARGNLGLLLQGCGLSAQLRNQGCHAARAPESRTRGVSCTNATCAKHVLH